MSAPDHDDDDLSEAEPLIGRAFGEFTIKEKLGEGGGGAVYRAEQATLGREAVIKVMSEAALEDPSAADRFLREARLASRLDHPFMAHVYGFGSEPDGTLWIAMELVRGASLDELIRQGPIPLPRFIPFLERLCEVLFAAHEQGIVHRDIKPQNVMVVNRSGKLLPKLLDLGIARRETDASDLVEQASLEARKESLTKALTDLGSRLAESETMNITMAGAIVGTPQYMAPEQWMDSSKVDARSDLYSLAIMAYQAITGKNPYAPRGMDFIELLRAHNEDPLPPLPSSLPSALHAVLSKGAAKKPSDRYASAIEFSDAMRQAAGLQSESIVLPEFDKAVLETIVSDAPQPIAESCALIEAARTPRQQLDAVLVTRKVVIRYLGILALASRGRVGAGAPKDSPRVTMLLERLAADQLTERDWLTLAQELTRPFASRPSAYPIPELVQLFFSETDVQNVADGGKAWAVLLESPVPQADAPKEELLASLQKAVPELAAALQKSSFLFDYSLSVRREENERWMGTRRIRRLVQAVNDTPPAVGVPFLVDREGMPVLTLAPLLQVFAPSGGMPEELFFLEGAGRHGARLAALPGPFERQSEEVWAWFSAHVLDVTKSQLDQAQQEKPPYKGLSTFTTSDADNYFGREREAEEFANRLKASHLLAVVGPSGAGKSSFVLAGVLPLLPKGCKPVVMRPGGSPLAGLFARLQPLGVRIVSDDMTAVGAAVAESLRGDESMLLVVDQFEELVTLCDDATMRARFATALISIADHSSGKMRVVFTLRDDFLIKIQAIGPLRDRLSSSLQLVATPAREDLARVVTEPARRVGYGFDDPDLPLKMVEEVLEYPGALAMLSFTASQLWELRDRQLRQMRGKTYEALGGVGGALAHHAEATLGAMTPDEQASVREAFRHLVTAQGTRAVLSRKEMLEVLGGTPVAHSVIEKLIVARLLVSSETADGDDRIEIIHEALIISWPRLVGWSREDAETARFRDSLRASARQWDERGRPRGQLWRAEPLAEYKVWRQRFRGRLTQVEDAFAKASLGDELRGKRIKQGLSITAFVVLSIALVLILRAYQDSKRQYLALREEQARLALVDEKPLHALAYLKEAIDRGASSSEISEMLSETDRQLSGSLGVLDQHAVSVLRMKVSDDARWLVATWADGALSAMSLVGARPKLVLALGATCDLIEYAGESDLVWVGCADGAARKIDLLTGALVMTIHVSENTLIGLVRVEPAGTYIASAMYAGIFQFNETTQKVSTIIADETVFAWVAQASADRRVIAFYNGAWLEDFPGTYRDVLLWESGATRKVVLAAPAHTVAFSSTGSHLAIGDARGGVGVISLRGPLKWIWRRSNHTKPVDTLVFAPNDQTLFSSGIDAVIAWGATGELLWANNLGHLATAMCLSKNSTHLFVGGLGGTLLRLDAGTGEIDWRHHGHRGLVQQCVVVGNGMRLLSSGEDGSLREWDGSKSTSARMAGLAEVRDVQSIREESSIVLVAADGVWLVDGEGTRHSFFRQEIGKDDYSSVAATRTEVFFSHNNRFRVFSRSDGQVVADSQLSSAPGGAAVDPNGAIFAGVLGTGDVLLASREGKELGVLHSDKSTLTLGPFVDSDTLLTCGSLGVLVAWSVRTLRPLAQVQSHQSLCYVDVNAAGVIRTSALTETGVMQWRWDGQAFAEVSRQQTDFGVELLGEQNLALGSDGFFRRFSSNGLTLSKVPLRSGGFFRSTRSKGLLWFVDRSRFLAFVDVSHQPEVSLGHLHETRGAWGLSDGRLVPLPIKISPNL